MCNSSDGLGAEGVDRSSAAALRKVSPVSWLKQQRLELYVASFEAAYEAARAACPPTNLDRLDVAWSYALALETSENVDQVC
jgi:hypothetical protein